MVVAGIKGGKVINAISMTTVRDYDAEVFGMVCAQNGMDVTLAR